MFNQRNCPASAHRLVASEPLSCLGSAAPSDGLGKNYLFLSFRCFVIFSISLFGVLRTSFYDCCSSRCSLVTAMKVEPLPFWPSCRSIFHLYGLSESFAPARRHRPRSCCYRHIFWCLLAWVRLTSASRAFHCPCLAFCRGYSQSGCLN